MDTVPAQPLPAQPTVVTAAPRSGFSVKKLLLIAGGALVLLLVIGLGAFYLQGRFGATSNQPVTLTYWGLWESPEIMQPLIDAYQKENPTVTINYEQRPVEEHYATVKSRISQAGISDTQPDIVRVHNSWVPVLANYLSPIPRQVYTREEYESTFYAATKDNLLLNGNYYAVPLMMDGFINL